MVRGGRCVRAFWDTLPAEGGRRIGFTWPLGGEQDFRQTSAAYEEIKASAHAGRDVRLQAMATVDGGTGELRFYNVTAGIKTFDRGYRGSIRGAIVRFAHQCRFRRRVVI